MHKFKMTGFTRFLLLMLIVGPLAYMGASYYNGQDGLENLKRLFKGEIAQEKENANDETAPAPTPAQKQRPESQDNLVLSSQVAKLKDELRLKEQRIDSLYLENARLQQLLEEKEATLQQQEPKVKKTPSGPTRKI